LNLPKTVSVKTIRVFAHVLGWLSLTANSMVEQNISKALIFEDDTDWDIRIHSQMKDFARASRLLVQPIPGTSDQMLDPTYPRPGEAQGPQDFDIRTEVTTEPITSPYGDLERWDLVSRAPKTVQCVLRGVY